MFFLIQKIAKNQIKKYNFDVCIVFEIFNVFSKELKIQKFTFDTFNF
jgi:hypothetical protein